MSKWKTYIIDDYTPFNGLKYLGIDDICHATLDNTYIELIVTNGRTIDRWDRKYKESILIDSSKKLSINNLKHNVKEIFTFNSAKDYYKRHYDIDILEPTLYKQRKITI